MNPCVLPIWKVGKVWWMLNQNFLPQCIPAGLHRITGPKKKALWRFVSHEWGMGNNPGQSFLKEVKTGERGEVLFWKKVPSKSGDSEKGWINLLYWFDIDEGPHTNEVYVPGMTKGLILWTRNTGDTGANAQCVSGRAGVETLGRWERP